MFSNSIYTFFLENITKFHVKSTFCLKNGLFRQKYTKFTRFSGWIGSKSDILTIIYFQLVKSHNILITGHCSTHEKLQKNHKYVVLFRSYQSLGPLEEGGGRDEFTVKFNKLGSKFKQNNIFKGKYTYLVDKNIFF